MSISQFEDVTQNLINLRHVKIIKKKDLILPKWIYLKNLYKEGKESSVVVKSCVSIINSILFQERIYFCITRESLRELLKSDTNWGPNGIGLDDHNYAEIKARLFQSKNIIEVEKGLGRSPGILELVGAEYLKFLVINKDAQLVETKSFNDRFKPKNKKQEAVVTESVSSPKNDSVPEDIEITLKNIRNGTNLELSYEEISKLNELEVDNTTYEIHPKTKKLTRFQNGERVNMGPLEDFVKYFEYNNINIKYWASLMPNLGYISHLEDYLRQQKNNV